MSDCYSKIYNKCGLELLSENVEDNSLNLALIDPPYLISKETGMNKLNEIVKYNDENNINEKTEDEWGEYKSKNNIQTDDDKDKYIKYGTIYGKAFKSKHEFGDWDHDFTMDKLEEFIKLYYKKLKSGGTIIIWFDWKKITLLNDLLEKYKYKQIRFIEWIKKNPKPLNSSTNYLTNAREIALTACKDKKPTFNNKYDKGIYEYPIPPNKFRFHPTQKSIPLFEDIIKKHTNEGDLVCDTFLGGGTTATACHNTNRKFIGSEIDKGYYDNIFKYNPSFIKPEFTESITPTDSIPSLTNWDEITESVIEYNNGGNIIATIDDIIPNEPVQILNEEQDITQVIKPLAHWVGGKSRLLNVILPLFPKEYNVYYELFLGSGSVLLGFQPKIAFAYELNSNICNAFQKTKNNTTSLIKQLKTIQDEWNNLPDFENKGDPRDIYYYKKRDEFNININNPTTIKQVVLFIFIMRTCYCGGWRQNANTGNYNIPIGNRKNINMPTEENINSMAKYLSNKNIKIINADFESSYSKIKEGDFVYIDPPYYPLKENSFTDYTPEGFGQSDHDRLIKLCHNIHKKGAKFMMSNSNSDYIKNNFKEDHFKIHTLAVARTLSGDKSKRGKNEKNEVIIMNY